MIDIPFDEQIFFKDKTSFKSEGTPSLARKVVFGGTFGFYSAVHPQTFWFFFAEKIFLTRKCLSNSEEVFRPMVKLLKLLIMSIYISDERKFAFLIYFRQLNIRTGFPPLL
jgi:hypothetical protein